MSRYRVIWEIDIEAENELEAISDAKEIQLDPNSTATFFTVIDIDKNTEKLIELQTENQPIIKTKKLH